MSVAVKKFLKTQHSLVWRFPNIVNKGIQVKIMTLLAAEMQPTIEKKVKCSISVTQTAECKRIRKSSKAPGRYDLG
ncbi:hypothetical protein [Desulfitobacterium hafniense]|uniref:hypothetical protein n=1 Tax=Desulfitobacterium hafniense TaxID=49338 RepID=UPI00059CA2A6|nr:hypothetical protein [Desulfitobacterium hafniense]